MHRFGTTANLPRDAGPSPGVFMDLLLEDAYNKMGIRILIWQGNYSSSPAGMSSSETQLYLQTIVVMMVWERTWVSQLILRCVI